MLSYAMISGMNKRRERDEPYGRSDLADRLREAVSRPLEEWCEVYEGFSPVDLETGERRPRMPPPGTDSRRAAVLVPILVEGEDARVVYTVRKDDLADHAGQISFPGGSIESGDGSLMETALRESEEEIDLSPDLVEVVGELEEMYTVSRAPLTADETFRKVLWRRDGRDYEVPVFAIGGPVPRNIWGATAAITAALLARLGWRGYRR